MQDVFLSPYYSCLSRQTFGLSSLVCNPHLANAPNIICHFLFKHDSFAEREIHFCYDGRWLRAQSSSAKPEKPRTYVLEAVADGLDALVAFATIRIQDEERNTERKIETKVGINGGLRRQYPGTLNCAIKHVGRVPNLIGERLIRGCQSRSLVASIISLFITRLSSFMLASTHNILTHLEDFSTLMILLSQQARGIDLSISEFALRTSTSTLCLFFPGFDCTDRPLS